jgi:hypothetical protein
MAFVDPSRMAITAVGTTVRRWEWPKSSSDIALLPRSPMEDTPT